LLQQEPVVASCIYGYNLSFYSYFSSFQSHPHNPHPTPATTTLHHNTRRRRRLQLAVLRRPVPPPSTAGQHPSATAANSRGRVRSILVHRLQDGGALDGGGPARVEWSCRHKESKQEAAGHPESSTRWNGSCG
jgi:hypothetical protein